MEYSIAACGNAMNRTKISQQGRVRGITRKVGLKKRGPPQRGVYSPPRWLGHGEEFNKWRSSDNTSGSIVQNHTHCKSRSVTVS